MIHPFAIVGLSVAVCAFLLRRLYHRREIEILAALGPRLYLAGVYILIGTQQTTEEQRIILVRLAWTLYLVVELVNHISHTERYRRLARWIEQHFSRLFKTVAHAAIHRR